MNLARKELKKIFESENFHKMKLKRQIESSEDYFSGIHFTKARY